MDYAAIQARAAFLAQACPSAFSIAPQPDWKALVNRGVQDFSWDTEYNYENGTFPTVADTAEYTIAAAGTPSWKFLEVMVRDSTGQIIPSDEQREYARNPLWIAQASSVPTRYWMSKPNTVYLFPVPSGVYTITYRGCREAAALSLTTDTPGCPGTYHEGIALRAAILHIEPFMSQSSEMAKLDLYRTQYSGLVKSFRKVLAADDVQKQRSTTPRLPELVWPIGYVRGSGIP